MAAPCANGVITQETADNASNGSFSTTSHGKIENAASFPSSGLGTSAVDSHAGAWEPGGSGFAPGGKRAGNEMRPSGQ